MPTFKIVTINILSDLKLWEKRRWLISAGLVDLEPDLVALHEVSITENNTRWLADQLGFPHVHLTPKTGAAGNIEGIAILSRLEVEDRASLDLMTQNRVAQYVRVRIDGQPVILANGHFLWQPGESPQRQRQIERLLEWLEPIERDYPVVIAGDFNSTPDTAAIQIMRHHFVSAYAAIHGAEPEYTAPTPLPRSKWKTIRTLLNFIRYIRIKDIDLNWRGTLDYIFVSERVQVNDCQIVLDKPSPRDPDLYPSDHLGLMAVLEI